MAALALCLAATGCKVGPNFAEPTAKLGDSFQQAGDPAVATDRQTYENWWTAFNDPTLDRLVATAYRENLTLLAAGTRVLEARATLGIAIGDFYPQQQQVGAGLNYNRLTGNDPSSTTLQGLGGFWRDSLSASAAWELDFWGRFRRGVQAADAAYLGSIATYDQVLVTLVGDVGSTYVGIRTLQAQLAIARSNVERQKQALQIARERFRGGATTGLDVAQAENVLAQTEAVIPQLTAQLEAGKATLRVLLGMPAQSIDVLLAGAKVGHIAASPQLLGDSYRVAVRLKVLESVKIPRKSRFVVGSANLLGDKYIDVIPAGDMDPADVWQPGEVIEGSRSGGFDELTARGGEVLDELSASLKQVQTLTANLNGKLLNETNMSNLEQTFQNLRETSESFKKSSLSLDSTLVKFGDIADKTGKTVDSLQKITKTAADGKGALGVLVNDKETGENLKSLIYNLRRSGVLFYRDKAVPESETKQR
jgi:methyl-accepting chemotaxis protein